MITLREFIKNNISNKLQEKLENILGISLIIEMAQINTDDNSNSYYQCGTSINVSNFPWNKYKLCIYGDDLTPAHFHIISKQESLILE